MISDIAASMLPLQPTCTSIPKEIETSNRNESQKTVTFGISGNFVVDRRWGRKCSFFPLLDFNTITESLVLYVSSFTYEVCRDSIVVDL